MILFCVAGIFNGVISLILLLSLGCLIHEAYDWQKVMNHWVSSLLGILVFCLGSVSWLELGVWQWLFCLGCAALAGYGLEFQTGWCDKLIDRVAAA